MLDVLLLKIDPLVSVADQNAEYLKDDSEVTINVSPTASIVYTVKQKSYLGSEYYNERVGEIQDQLDINFGGDAIAIDKYPKTRYVDGVEPTDKYSGIKRYELEGISKDPKFDVAILICPDFKTVVLANLNFAYYGDAQSSEDQLVFSHQSVLSFKTLFGQVHGVALYPYKNLALNPDYPSQYYSMTFEKIRCPDVVLKYMLEQM